MTKREACDRHITIADVFWDSGRLMVENPIDCMLIWIALASRVAGLTSDPAYHFEMMRECINDLEERANRGQIL